ncbi:MAG: hypothetical protein EXR48_02940 [Dehalococcoidia bacterium]|nr:hypothetical protein [Dehalococcoidia bacterium]
MEGRYPNGLLFALTECTDPSKEAEFDDWYHKVHIPDVTSSGVFRQAIRFVNPTAKPGEGKSLVTYETEHTDVGKLMKELMASAQSMPRERMFPAMKAVGAGAFKRIGGEYRARYGRPVCGVLCAVTNCEPSREKEFNAWYNDVHLLDILDTKQFHTAYRYESTDPSATGGKFLAIYETDLDPFKAAQALAAHAPDWQKRGRVFDGSQLIRVFTGKRVWPMD